jgi:hypothetical protein
LSKGKHYRHGRAGGHPRKSMFAYGLNFSPHVSGAEANFSRCRIEEIGPLGVHALDQSYLESGVDGRLCGHDGRSVAVFASAAQKVCLDAVQKWVKMEPRTRTRAGCSGR